MKWYKNRQKKANLIELAEAKHRDFLRPVRIMNRLKMRIDEAGDRGDLARMDVLIRRSRRVRDFQIAEWGF